MHVNMIHFVPKIQGNVKGKQKTLTCSDSTALQTLRYRLAIPNVQVYTEYLTVTECVPLKHTV